jgi:hypothetical protein
MGTTVFILGESGTGKSSSIETLNPKETLVIKTIAKPFPFRSADWKKYTKDNPDGSVLVTDNSSIICKVIEKTEKKIIIIDDFQYIMANEFMRGVDKQYSGGEAFQRFNVIAKNVYNIMEAGLKASEDKRIYFLAHTEETASGRTKVKTIGKLLDEKVVLEGLCTIVLRTVVTNGVYEFSTQNNGEDTCKSPKGMFEGERIPNDLLLVDQSIKSYYGFN